jgi:glycosyltransferase involved in cell wall biosynthesis
MTARPLHVLSLIGHLGFGGAENRLLSLARHIDRKRFAHWTVAVDPASEEASAMLKQFNDAGVDVMRLPNGESAKWSRLAGRVCSLCKMIEQLDIDIVDAHCESAALLAAIAGVITGRSRVATLYHPHALFAPRFWKVAEQFIFTELDLVITDSEQRASEIRGASRFRSLDVVVAPNGILPPQPARDIRGARSQFGLPEDPRVRVIGQISTLRKFKGQLILLEAAKSVLAANPEAFFLIVGYEKDEPGFLGRLLNRVNELGISDRVRIMDYSGPIGDVWSVIDIHVHASVFDSLPNAIIEGMSLAKPAIVTSVGGIPEAVTHGETGLIVPPGDPVSLGAAIIRLLRDSTLAAGLGQSAFRRYQQMFRPEVMTRRLESCFTGVARGCSPPFPLWTESAGAKF